MATSDENRESRVQCIACLWVKNIVEELEEGGPGPGGGLLSLSAPLVAFLFSHGGVGWGHG